MRPTSDRPPRPGWPALFLMATALALGPLPAANPARAASPAALISRVPTTHKWLALTFDDGPTPTWTPRILAVLEANRVPATFFVIGQQVERYPQLVQQEVKAGMEIGNHGYRHQVLRRRDPGSVRKEVEDNAHLLQSLGVPKPTLYRLPAGVSDPTAMAVLGELGYRVIGWTIDPRDWRHRFSAEQMAQLVIRNAQPGAIIIFHDGTNSSAATVQAVSTLIPALKQQGYQFVTVGRLLSVLPQRTRPPL
jgi:peptidoglycan/xylan/chitin deacetylase (PgdA/CDA1 family)